MKTSINAIEANELRALYRSLPPLVWSAANAIKTNAPDMSMRGAELLRFREQHAQVVAVMTQIMKIVQS